MKKLLSLFVFTFALSSSAFCGVVTWGAGNVNASFNNGTAYLVSVKDSSITTEAIASYIQASGLGYDGDAFAQQGGSATIGDLGGVYGVTDVGGGTVGLEANDWRYFVIVISEDGASFALSGFDTPILADDDAPYSPIFGEDGESEWTTGAIAGTDPSVPEPTALALLALGVAGLALKRRVA